MSHRGFIFPHVLPPSFFHAVRLRNFPVLQGMAAAGKVARRLPPPGVEMKMDDTFFDSAWPPGTDFWHMEKMKGRLM